MDHYFSAEPQSTSAEHLIPLALADGRVVELLTDAGVFSAERVDPGTQILLSEAPFPPPNSAVLDLGCGYGPIAIWYATAQPTAQVLAIDVNERALDLCRRNAQRLNLTNVEVQAVEEVGDDQLFDVIYSNPPARIGKNELHDLLLRWLGRLKQDGTAYLVVQKHLGSDSLAEWLREQSFNVQRIASKRAYRVFRVSN